MNRASAPAALGYRPQLDALRAAAVATVLLWHFGSRPTPIRAFAVSAGVRLFFVLSGFLITSILLHARDTRDGQTHAGAAARRFYLRRGLRVAPVYYATLLIALAAGVPAVRNALAWHAAYLSNVLFALRGQWDGPTSHFWSLAVEEQFYLLWPWLVLCLAPRRFRHLTIAAVLVAPALRLVATLQGYAATDLLLIGCLDSLGCGALLAVCRHEGTWPANQKWLTVAAACASVSLAVLLAQRTTTTALPALQPTLLSIVLTWVVAGAVRGFSGPAGKCLEWRPLLYIGKVSYGIYLFHNFMPSTLSYVERLGAPVVPGPGRVVVLVGMTIACASLSWTFFERPINQLRPALEPAMVPVLIRQPAVAL
jgi:peptidoglycan/LPS O-acetylase OafA/YrhL